MAGTDLIKPDDLGINALAPSAESAALLDEALAGERLTLGDFPRIKWPTGGQTKFARTILGNDEYVDSLVGVIVHQGMSRSYWSDPNPVEGTPPDCVSPDAQFGYGDPGDALRAQSPPQGCEVCPMAAFGSSKNPNSPNSQACKLSRDLFLLVQGGGILPLCVSIPPGSLGNAKQYLVGLAEYGMSYYTVLTELSLTKATSKQGQAFAEAKFRLAGKLDEPTIEAARDYKDKFGESFRRVMRDDSKADDGDTVEGSASEA